MNIKTVTLSRFRNLTDVRLELDPGVNILYGDNAQGKTNIIEAIRLFSTCKSFRVSQMGSLIQSGEKQSAVSVVFEKYDRTYTGVFRLSSDRKREILLNGVSVTPRELIGEFQTVLFYPEHLNLIKDGPEVRRKFIDLAISQVKPKYVSVLSEYHHVLEQRNALLKQFGQIDTDMMAVWNEKLARLSVLIALTRSSYLKRLSVFSEQIIDEISEHREKLSFQYKTYTDPEVEKKEIQEQRVFEALQQSVERDMRYGYTSIGAHRDDILIYLNEKRVDLFGSQGQQRSCVMAMKLAEAEIVYDTCHEYPVILLDDIFSELDEVRKQYIVEKIKGKQVILSSCEQPSYFSDAKLFRIRNGCVDV